MADYIGISKQLALTRGTKPLDVNAGPYESIAAALAALDSGLRYIGLTALIVQNNQVVEYWFNGGISDANFVQKNVQGIDYGSINFVKLTQAQYDALEVAEELEDDVLYLIVGEDEEVEDETQSEE